MANGELVRIFHSGDAHYVYQETCDQLDLIPDQNIYSSSFMDHILEVELSWLATKWVITEARLNSEYL